MKSLARGNSSDPIFKLIKVLISVQQSDYEQALGGDINVLGDISDNIETDQKLFKKSEVSPAGMMDHSFLNFNDDEEQELNE